MTETAANDPHKHEREQVEKLAAYQRLEYLSRATDTLIAALRSLPDDDRQRVFNNAMGEIGSDLRAIKP
jgi:hypothetical protein